MSNSLNTNPATFTSPTGSFKSLITAGVFSTLLIEKVYWFGPANVGDTVSITDPITGAVLLNLKCGVANEGIVIDWTAAPKLWQDFAVSQISSGTLEIYFR